MSARGTAAARRSGGRDARALEDAPNAELAGGRAGAGGARGGGGQRAARRASRGERRGPSAGRGPAFGAAAGGCLANGRNTLPTLMRARLGKHGHDVVPVAEMQAKATTSERAVVSACAVIAVRLRERCLDRFIDAYARSCFVLLWMLLQLSRCRGSVFATEKRALFRCN